MAALLKDPALIVGLVRAILIFAISFGVAITQEQQDATLMLVGSALAVVSLVLTGASRDPVMRDVPGSNGLQLHVVERSISAADLAEHIPQGTGIRVPREPPCAGQGRARSRLRLPVRDRGPERPPLRPAPGPARCAGCGLGRAGG